MVKLRSTDESVVVGGHRWHVADKVVMYVDEEHDKLPTFY